MTTVPSATFNATTQTVPQPLTPEEIHDLSCPYQQAAKKVRGKVREIFSDVQSAAKALREAGRSGDSPATIKQNAVRQVSQLKAQQAADEERFRDFQKSSAKTDLRSGKVKEQSSKEEEILYHFPSEKVLASCLWGKIDVGANPYPAMDKVGQALPRSFAGTRKTREGIDLEILNQLEAAGIPDRASTFMPIMSKVRLALTSCTSNRPEVRQPLLDLSGDNLPKKSTSLADPSLPKPGLEKAKESSVITVPAGVDRVDALRGLWDFF